MRAAELLSELRELDVQVELDGDRLRLRAPKGALSDDHRRQLREHKAEIVKFLHEAEQLTGQQRAIVPLKATGTRIPMFGVGGHNGDVFCYRSLVQHTGVNQPFFGLRPPGLEEGTEPHTDVEGLAGYFAEQIRAFYPDGPITIAGFCAGGTVAFELARQLSESGRDVTRLMLFGAPYCAAYRFLPALIARCSQFVRRATVHARVLIGLPITEWTRYLADRTQARHAALGDAPRDPVMLRRAAVEKATVAAIRRYRPQAFNGHVDLMLPCESSKRSWDAPLRWRRHAATSAEFAGPDGCNGDTMLLPEYAATFAAFVKTARDQSPRRAPE
ncbi:MAG: thioesterase domain-containing protein [Gammaproteobacteria bacterium]|nr:thioesterase domain-containing protein [Gammaproteobacteria bacterium]